MNKDSSWKFGFKKASDKNVTSHTVDGSPGCPFICLWKGCKRIWSNLDERDDEGAKRVIVVFININQGHLVERSVSDNRSFNDIPR